MVTPEMRANRLDWLYSSKGGLAFAIRRFDELLDKDRWGSEIQLEGFQRGIPPRQVALERRAKLVSRHSEVCAEIAQLKS